MLLKGSKRGPAEGQVAGLGLQLHGTACGLDRILGNQETQLGNPCPPWSLVLGQVTTGPLGGAQPGLVGSIHLRPVRDCGGLCWQELEGGRLALLGVGSMDDS